MIIIPFIAGIIATIGTLVEPILISIGIGAAVGGGIGAVGGAIEGYQEYGEINSEAAIVMLDNAAHGAADGILWGGVFGVAGVVVGPAIGAASVVAKPVVAVADDIAGPAIRAFGNTIDDFAGPVLRGVTSTASSTVRSVGRAASAPYRMGRAAWHARFYKSMSKAVCSGRCIYVMDDAAHAARKIGVTSNAAQRIAAVQRDVGSKLKYVGLSPVDDAYGVERTMHRQFAGKNITHPNHAQGREWFAGLDPLDVATVLGQ